MLLMIGEEEDAVVFLLSITLDTPIVWNEVEEGEEGVDVSMVDFVNGDDGGGSFICSFVIIDIIIFCCDIISFSSPLISSLLLLLLILLAVTLLLLLPAASVAPFNLFVIIVC